MLWCVDSTSSINPVRAALTVSHQVLKGVIFATTFLIPKVIYDAVWVFNVGELENLGGPRHVDHLALLLEALIVIAWVSMLSVVRSGGSALMDLEESHAPNNELEESRADGIAANAASILMRSRRSLSMSGRSYLHRQCPFRLNRRQITSLEAAWRPRLFQPSTKSPSACQPTQSKTTTAPTPPVSMANSSQNYKATISLPSQKHRSLPGCPVQPYLPSAKSKARGDTAWLGLLFLSLYDLGIRVLRDLFAMRGGLGQRVMKKMGLQLKRGACRRKALRRRLGDWRHILFYGGEEKDIGFVKRALEIPKIFLGKLKVFLIPHSRACHWRDPLSYFSRPRHPSPCDVEHTSLVKCLVLLETYRATLVAIMQSIVPEFMSE